jgi:hypothetical protein
MTAVPNRMRLVRIKIAFQLLEQILKGGMMRAGERVETDLPADAEIIRINPETWSYPDVLEVVVRSAEFDEVESGNIIPLRDVQMRRITL